MISPKFLVLPAAIFSFSLLIASDFNTVVNNAAATNPDILATAAQNIADHSLMATENNLENPEISFEGLFGQFGDNKYNLELSQAFDWPGLYGARKRQLQASRQLAESTLKSAENDCRLQAAEALTSMIGSKLKIAELKAILDRYNTLKAAYTTARERGEVSVLDLNKLLIEIADLEAAITEENYSLYQSRSTLSSLCGGNQQVMDAADRLDKLPDFTLLEADRYTEAALANSPKIEAAKAQSLLSATALNTAAKETLPGFSLGYRFSHEDGQIFNGLTFGMSIPAWGNKGKKAAARSAVEASAIAERAAVTGLTQQLLGIHQSATNLKAQIDSYGNALIATDNLAILDKAYAQQVITLTDYIQDSRFFLEAESRLTDLRVRYASQLAALNILAGLQ